MNRWSRRLLRAWPIVFLLATLWVVRYLRSGEFGLYEDDLTHIPTAVQMTSSELLSFMGATVGNFQRQGTPLKLPISYGLANLGWGIGALRGLYWLGFAVIALNVTLFFLLARALHRVEYAVCAGLAYVLYSADTTQAFLTHSFVLQVSIAFLLLALLCYGRRPEPLAYLFMVFALMTYETTFPVFLGAPLLAGPWDGNWRRRSLRHVALCVAILAAVVLVRAAAGEGRLGSLTIGDAILLPVTHMLIGPPVALATYLYRPLQAIQSHRADVLLVSLLAAMLFTGVLWRVQLRAWLATTEVDLPPLRSDSTWRGTLQRYQATLARLPGEIRSSLRLLLAGAVMLVLAYPMTFTVRPYAISGRDTRVHAAGVVGASLLVGSALSLALAVAERQRRKSWVVPVLGVSLGLLAGYGMVIQNDYASAWSLQRGFWTHLVQLIPDVRDGSAVLVDPSGLQDTRQIGANYWNLPSVLQQLFVFPAAWETPPRVYRLTEDWQERVMTDDGRLRLDAATTFAPPSTFGWVDSEKVIYVRVRDGSLERASGAFPTDRPLLDLTPSPVLGEPPFPRRFLYGLMILPSGGAS